MQLVPYHRDSRIYSTQQQRQKKTYAMRISICSRHNKTINEKHKPNQTYIRNMVRWLFVCNDVCAPSSTRLYIYARVHQHSILHRHLEQTKMNIRALIDIYYLHVIHDSLNTPRRLSLLPHFTRAFPLAPY